MKNLQNSRSASGKFLIVILAYVLCHGLTAFLVTPIQGYLLPEITAFASLMYLPHGVRVLSTFFWGWKAVPLLFAGGVISDGLFTPSHIQGFQEPVIYVSIFIGAFSAYLGFESLRLLGRNYYSGGSRVMHWKQIVLVGSVASIFNSIGQSLVFRGIILPEDGIATFLTYAIGDIIGLLMAMFVLMMIFRWLRIISEPNQV